MIDHRTETPRNRFSTDDAPDPRPREAEADSHRSAADAFAPLAAHLKELWEYASYYFAARTDLVKVKVRKLVLYAVLGIIGAITAITSLIVAVVLVLNGIAGGLGELIAHRPWAGSLATGLILLAIAFGSLKLLTPHWLDSSRRKVKEKYDRRRQTQRSRFGHDVDEIRKS